MIPPAISVLSAILSAIEGVKVAAPSLAGLVGSDHSRDHSSAFLLQRLGTGAAGRLFGPVMGVGFAAIGACGVGGVAAHTDILKALWPTYALASWQAISRLRSSNWLRSFSP